MTELKGRRQRGTLLPLCKELYFYGNGVAPERGEK